MWSLCSLQHKSTNGALHQPVELHVHVCVRASFSHFASKHQCDQANLHTHMPSCDPLPTQLAVVDSSLKLHQLVSQYTHSGLNQSQTPVKCYASLLGTFFVPNSPVCRRGGRMVWAKVAMAAAIPTPRGTGASLRAVPPWNWRRGKKKKYGEMDKVTSLHQFTAEA